MSNSPVRHDRVMTTGEEAELASQVLRDLRGSEGALNVERRGERVGALPAPIGQILQHVLEVMARGGTVTVSAVPAELTTSAAASILRVSRPTLMKLIRDGEIAAHKVGSHHRLMADDVFALRRERRARERAAFDELRELDDRFDQ